MSNQQLSSENVFDISGKKIKALLSIAGKNDIRYWINGIHVEQSENGTLIIVSDGRMLAVWRICDIPRQPRHEFFPRDMLQTSAISKTERAFYQIDLSTPRARIGNDMFSINAANDDAKKPIGWQHVVPAFASTSAKDCTESIPPNLNPRFITLAWDYLSVIGGVSGSIISYMPHFRGDNSSVVYNTPHADAFVIIMPIRDDYTVRAFERPYWSTIAFNKNEDSQPPADASKAERDASMGIESKQ